MNRYKFNSVTRWGILLIGCILFLLGTIVIIGWLAEILLLVQVNPSFAPMQFNTALGFVLCGASVILLFITRRLAALLGVLVFILGALSLSQYIFEFNLGIDTFFIKSPIMVETSHPGRMAPNTAFNFILSGIALFLASGKKLRRGSVYTISILSGVVLLLGALSLIGYVFDFSVLYGWGMYTSMAVHTSASFFLLGIALFLLVMGSISKRINGLVLLLGPLVTLIITMGYLSAESEKISLVIDMDKTNLINRFSEYFVVKGQALERLKSRVADKGFIAQEKDIEKFMQDFPALEKIVWVDSQKKVQYIHGEKDVDILDISVPDLSTLDFKKIETLPYFEIISEKNKVKHVAMILPLSDSLMGGFFVAFMHVDTLFEIGVYRHFAKKIHLIVSNKGDNIYTSSAYYDPKELVLYNRWQVSEYVQFNDIELLFTIWPKGQWLRTLQGLGPFVFLILLVTLSVMGVVVTYFLSSKLRLKRQYALLLNSSGEGIYGLDLEGKATFVNPSALSMLGWEEEELIGKVQHQMIHHTKEDGTPYPLDECPVYLSLKEGKQTQSDNELYWKKDGTSIDVALTSRPIVVKKKVKGVVVTFRDISIRKQLEKDLLTRSEELANSYKELEMFSYSVSHDLRAPLRQVIGFIELIREDKELKLSEENQKYFNFITSSAQQMQQLIDDLLSFSRLSRAKIEKSTISLNALVEDIKSQLMAGEDKARNIQWNIGPLPTVRTDRTLIYTVLLNLISNALKFTQHESQAVISILSEEQENEWMISIHDNGVGFDEKYKNKLFKVFQRLHSETEFVGTGIGLANVARVITRLEGRVWAEGEENQGARFYFTLPK